MHLNLLDYLFIGIMLLSAWAGYRQGLMNAIGGLLGILGGLVLAIQYRGELAFYLDKQYSIISLLNTFLAERMPAPFCYLEWGAMGRGLGLPEILIDPMASLAQLLLSLLCFLLIFISSSFVIKLLFAALNRWLSCQGWDYFNRFSGLFLVSSKNLIIIVLLTGMLYPAINLAARMGSAWAITMDRSLNMSFFLPWFLGAFACARAWLGI